MSGTIAVGEDCRWSAANWLFDWVLNFLAERADAPPTSSRIREIVEENLGWLDLADFSSSTRVRILGQLRHELGGLAEAELPSSIPNRPAVLDHVRRLAELASA